MQIKLYVGYCKSNERMNESTNQIDKSDSIKI